MIFKKSISSLHLPHYKGTADMASEKIAPPEEVIIPLAGAAPVVSVGDNVKIGTLIAKEEGRNSVPMHATVSGTIAAIEAYEGGAKPDTAIRIKSDGLMEVDPDLKAPEVNDLDSFLGALRLSGVVGLGGASFPVWSKLDAARKNHIKTVLINGAECEPYITSDDRMMRENAELIKAGVELLKKYLQSEEFIFGIEKNKPEAIKIIQDTFKGDDTVKVMPLDSVYPQGAKQVLLYNATGLVVGEGQRLASLGVIIINVSTLAKSAEYLTTGMPLVEKTVTVDGTNVVSPKNLLVPIGTPIKDLLNACGGLKSEGGKVIYGGPMMGKCAKSIDNPVLKATNAIVALSEKDSQPLTSSPCIHCGRCVAACPLSLNPTVFDKSLLVENEDERMKVLEKAKVSLCMECGCCQYVCPAHRPLVETNKKAKNFVRKVNADRKAAAEAAKEGEKK